MITQCASFLGSVCTVILELPEHKALPRLPVIARRGASPDEAIQSCIFLVCRAPTGLAMTDSNFLILISISWIPAYAGMTARVGCGRKLAHYV